MFQISDSSERRTLRASTPTFATACLLGAVVFATPACSAGWYKNQADEEVLDVLDVVSNRVRGETQELRVERPDDTLREAILDGTVGTESEPLRLSLSEALDVAGENSRTFQTQRELLYLTALNLTGVEAFELIAEGGGSATIDGVGDDDQFVTLTDDLSASVNSVRGGNIVASFANNFFRNIVSSGGFDATSVLSLSVTQPLLRGFGRTVNREILTQAERDVVYQLRAFDRFRKSLAIDVVQSYYNVVQQVANLESVRNNFESVRADRLRIEALIPAGRATINDLGRAQQNELSAENNIVVQRANLQTFLDSFKFLLGLPVETVVELDRGELESLRALAEATVELEESAAIELALLRRYDYRTVLDEVDDAVRDVIIAENGLHSAIDFTGTVVVPDENGISGGLDFSRIEWAAGFDLDLELDRTAERNTYRSSLISLEQAIRAREASADRITQDVRLRLRDVNQTQDSLRIQLEAVRVARLRVASTQDLFEAGRVQTFDVLDAKTDLLGAELSVNSELVNLAISRLELLFELEGIDLVPDGLRYDLELRIPDGPEDTVDATYRLTDPNGPDIQKLLDEVRRL